jgi:hypothetical protein
VVRSLLPPELGTPRRRHHRYGWKVWCGAGPVAREHYEAQVVGPRYVPEATTLAQEVGFHAEHPKPDDNQQVLARLTGAEAKWRRRLGPDAVAGPFLGRDSWCRLSETWPDLDLGDPDLPVEIGTRLLDYIVTIEPVRR